MGASKQTVVTNAQENGIHLNNERFVVFRAEGRSLYGRKGREGICAVQTSQAIIVGHYGEGQQAGNCSVAVEGLADYLIGQGY
ncbi:profilin, required for normal timing of actin polymerization in response to thermal stress [Ceratocystis pirilliformis]|uniref:Profilin n=1 Tax=Ceratocystis pirilliformis TaxID=259994 RepID=A0ABR3ZE23_9PEZI